MNRAWLKYLPRPLQERLDARHNLQGIISNSGWLLADNFFRMSVGLILGTLIARYLGPESYGLLRYSMAFVAVFAVIATLGLEGVVVRELTVRPELKDVILGSTFAIKIMGGLVAYGIVLGSIAIKEPAGSETMVLVAIIATGLLFNTFDTIGFWFQSQVQARSIVLARGIVFSLISAVKVWLLLVHASLYAFALTSMIEVALGGVGLAIAFKVAGNSVSNLRFRWSMVRDLLRESWPLALSGTFVLLTMQLDKILLGELAGNAEVGVYSVANQLSSIWYMVPMIVGASIAPSFARSHASGDARYAATLQKVYTTLTHIAVPTAIVLFFLSNYITLLLFGPEYRGAGAVLAIHIWGAIFVFHVSIRTRALVAEGKQKFVTAMAALTLLSSVLLNFALIGPYGALGAAYASLISWALCATVFPILWRETRPSAKMFFSSFKAYAK